MKKILVFSGLILASLLNAKNSKATTASEGRQESVTADEIDVL